MEIKEGHVVSLRYVMQDKDGVVMEDIVAGPAVQYLHGSGGILPTLEDKLEGLKPGDKKQLEILEPAYFLFDIVIDDVRPATEEEIVSGKVITGKNCGPEGCC